MVGALLWLCGMDGVAEPPGPAEPGIASLEEQPRVKTLLDLSLVVCVGCAVFLWGYFA